MVDFGKFVKNVKGLKIWWNNIAGHCETIFSHWTKVIKILKANIGSHVFEEKENLVLSNQTPDKDSVRLRKLFGQDAESVL